MEIGIGMLRRYLIWAFSTREHLSNIADVPLTKGMVRPARHSPRSHWTSRPEMERRIVAFQLWFIARVRGVAIIPANQTTLNNAPLSPSGIWSERGSPTGTYHWPWLLVAIAASWIIDILCVRSLSMAVLMQNGNFSVGGSGLQYLFKLTSREMIARIPSKISEPSDKVSPCHLVPSLLSC